MKLIVGLGNPGKKYDKTRHNFGYMVLDKYAQKNQLVFNKTKFSGSYCEFFKNEEKVILLKPEKYMNLSGEVVVNFLDYFKIKQEDLFVIHDDLDIELGKIKLKQSGSSGGNNGVANIILHLASDDFKRLKLGISKTDGVDTSNYVLSNFSKAESKMVEEVIEKSCDLLDDYFEKDFLKLMNKYN